MKLLIIRHGQSSNNKVAETGTGERSPDPGLTDLGHAQARALGAWLKEHGARPGRVHTSLMKRTIQTAAPLADDLDLPLEARGDLFECGGPYLGNYQEQRPAPGSSRAELQSLTPRVRLPEQSTDQGWWTASVESAAAALSRALDVAQWLREQPDELVALVIHGAFGSMLISALTQPDVVRELAARNDASSLDLPVWYRLDNTSTSLIELTSTTTTVQWINRIDHLSGLEHEISRANNPFPPAFDSPLSGR